MTNIRAARSSAVLYAKDIGRMRSFYEHTIGLTIAEHDADFVVLDSPSARLTIVAIPRHIADGITIASPPERREETAIKLVFAVDDIALARSRAESAGGIVDSTEREWTWQGDVVCDGHDPEGNVFQVRARPQRQRSSFAGGDQSYLRDEQYRNSDRLAIRARLHERYSTSLIRWPDWVSSHYDLSDGALVLEVGCGAGFTWEQSGEPIPADVRLTLTDLSPGMVDEAVARATSTGRFASVGGQPADAQELPFADGAFDRVIANHMLYHLPDPSRGVAELARVVAPDGTVIVGTNGRHHMRELWKIRGDIFDLSAVDQTIDVFGTDVGFPILREYFGDVRWLQFEDGMICTDPADAIAYLCSTPPAETADADQLAQIVAAIHAAFDREGGQMTITKDTGCFVCTRPRHR